jgi:hypothetical protein
MKPKPDRAPPAKLLRKSGMRASSFPVSPPDRRSAKGGRLLHDDEAALRKMSDKPAGHDPRHNFGGVTVPPLDVKAQRERKRGAEVLRIRGGEIFGSVGH